LPRHGRKSEALLAGVALILGLPLLLLIAIGIWISDPGPIFYVTDRMGLHGSTFRMYKLRTMRIAAVSGSRIAVTRDPRVFPFGALLRRLKLDELPQLLNIFKGEMAFVGPRPEDPWFVKHAYTAADRETLKVLPGLTSPGTLWYVAEAEKLIDRQEIEASYVSGPLKTRLELDRAYIAEASGGNDLRLAIATIQMLARMAIGREPR
jgi:lipopolysaccharide/colanic/teichoic acid biosynthesis glycosyltransferase